MEKPNLTQLKELLAAATKQPWAFNGYGSSAWCCISAEVPGMDGTEKHWIVASMTRQRYEYRDKVEGGPVDEEAKANAELIVAAVNALPSLLAEREALRLLLFECARELSYVQCVENCNSGLCATSLGADLVERSIKALDIPDLHEREEEWCDGLAIACADCVQRLQERIKDLERFIESSNLSAALAKAGQVPPQTEGFAMQQQTGARNENTVKPRAATGKETP